eukprot:scaffold323260_cov44-Tisochrysis_lutea.AAC.3
MPHTASESSVGVCPRYLSHSSGVIPLRASKHNMVMIVAPCVVTASTGVSCVMCVLEWIYATNHQTAKCQGALLDRGNIEHPCDKRFAQSTECWSESAASLRAQLVWLALGVRLRTVECRMALLEQGQLSLYL